MALRQADKWPSSLTNTLMPIIKFLEDDSITEVMVNRYDSVWCKGSMWRGHRRMEGAGWVDRNDFGSACQKISEVVRRRLSEDRPILNGRLPGGERVNVAFYPACEDVSLTIRKFPADPMTLDLLHEKFGSISAELKTMLRSIVLAKKSTLVAGGTGSGKTSVLNALSLEIPKNERIVTIEDSRELQIQQPNWVALETVEPYKDGSQAIGIDDLVKNALRMTPDRIVVGEVRDGAAFYLWRAFNSGHGGGFGTIHANSAVEALIQGQFLAQMAPVGGLDTVAIAGLVASAVDIVVFADFYEDYDGSRKITEILEVEKPGVLIHENRRVEYLVRTLAKYKIERIEGEGANAVVVGRWEFPNRPSQKLRDQIQFKGLDWPEASLLAGEPKK